MTGVFIGRRKDIEMEKKAMRSGWGTHVNPWLILSMYDKTHYN